MLDQNCCMILASLAPVRGGITPHPGTGHDSTPEGLSAGSQSGVAVGGAELTTQLPPVEAKVQREQSARLPSL